jgi:predicted MPP superfamily phosphohydrolase
MKFNLRQSHEHPCAFDTALFVVAVLGVLVAYISFQAGGAWQVLGWLIVLCECVLAYSAFIEPQRLVVARYREALVAEPKTWVSIVLLTDTHAGGFKSATWFERVSREVAALHPDVILFGGDAVVDRAEPVPQLVSFKGLRAPLGKFFVLGNHDCTDRPQDIRAAFLSFGFRDLTNSTVRLEKEGSVLELQGIDDLWFGNPEKVHRSSPDIPHVTLSHIADILLDLKEKDTDLVLSGHTHGGQVNLPIVGPLWPTPSFLDRRKCRGRIVQNGVPAIISNGLGESDGRVRLSAPPEIVLVEVGF